jgi:O-succinylbenzoate synthase
MARLSAFTYELLSTHRGRGYFPSGKREGLFISIDHDDEHFGIGEYAPCVGIHQHSIFDVLSVVQDLWHKVKDDLFSLDPKLTFDEYAKYFDNFLGPYGFLFSMAHCHRRLRTVACPKRLSVKLSALIESSSVNNATMVANDYLLQGFSCLKIKVGSLPAEEEIKKIKTIAAIANGGIKFRLDANRKFCFRDAIRLVKGLRPLEIEYFEEPFFDTQGFKTFYEETGAHIAVDESFLAPYDYDALVMKGIKFLIIKPTRFKSIYHAMNCAQAALHHRIVPIFSHCFESEFSAALFALIIERLALCDHFHGVFAEGFFQQGVSLEPWQSVRGQLFLESCHKVIDREFLHSSPVIKRIF